MNPEEFVNLIDKTVLESTVKSMQSNLNEPPGRKPSENLVMMSNWYNKLSNQDKEVITQIIRESARGSVFGFLCVLDGVRAIENENKGELKLYYERDGIQLLLNDRHKVSLHELL